MRRDKSVRFEVSWFAWACLGAPRAEPDPLIDAAEYIRHFSTLAKAQAFSAELVAGEEPRCPESGAALVWGLVHIKRERLELVAPNVLGWVEDEGFGTLEVAPDNPTGAKV